MQNSTAITNYFFDATCIAYIFFIVGTLTLIFACIFLGIIKYLFFKGMAYPLLIIGVLHYITGLLFFNAAKKSQLNMLFCDNITVVKTELNQIEALLTQVATFIFIETLLLFFCALLYFYSYKNKSAFWKGLFLGVMMQTVIFLSLHLVFIKSAKSYQNELNILILKTKANV